VDFRFVDGTSADLGELADLWLQMLAHHRALVSDRFPMHDREASWELARAGYRDWIRDGSAIMRIARALSSSEPLGFVVCRLVADGPTFDHGPMLGDIDALVVRDTARSLGIGTALLDSVRGELLARDIAYWSIGVLAQNMKAEAFYRRLGFQPWSHALLAKTTNP